MMGPCPAGKILLLSMTLGLPAIYVCLCLSVLSEYSGALTFHN